MRQVMGGVVDLSRYVIRTGAWWFPAIVMCLAIGAVAAASAQVAVPTVVYVLF